MARELVIDGKRIADDTDAWVIAEVGHNHQGDIGKCCDLFKAAKECDANAVKLQKRDNRALFTRAMYDRPYDNENSFGRTYGEHREFLEFGLPQYQRLKAYTRELGITFFATAFDEKSADFLAALDVPVFKIASGDHKNLPLIKHVASFGKPMIASLGAASMDDAQRIYDAVMPINRQLALLQCTTIYPTPAEALNLRVISSLRERFPEVVVGLSDHYNGISMSVAAYVLGARIFEKHFTLNHTWKGTDHPMSLEPIGLAKMVRDLRRLKLALGDGVKRPLPEEVAAMNKMGKKLVAARALPAGHRLTSSDLAIKSPGDGLPPFDIDRMVGRVLAKPMAEDDDLRLDLLTER